MFSSIIVGFLYVLLTQYIRSKKHSTLKDTLEKVENVEEVESRRKCSNAANDQLTTQGDEEDWTPTKPRRNDD